MAHLPFLVLYSSDSKDGIMNITLFLRILLAAAISIINDESAFSTSSQQEAKRFVDTQALMELRELNGLNVSSGLSVSPNGRWALVLEQKQDLAANLVRFHWVLVDLHTPGEPVGKYDAGGYIIAKDAGVRENGAFNYITPIWNKTSEWFLLVRQKSGEVKFWQGVTSSRQLRRITDVPGEIDSVYLAADETTVLFSKRKSRSQLAEALAAEHDSGYLFDDRFIPRISKAPLSDKPVYSRISSKTVLNTEWFILNLRKKTIRQASGVEVELWGPHASTAKALSSVNSIREPVATTGEGLFAWRESLDPEKQGIMAPVTVVASTPRGERVVCQFPQCTSEFFNLRGAGDLIRPDKERILFTRREGKGGKDLVLYEWRPDENKLRKVQATIGALADCQVANDHWICFESGPKEPRKLVSISLRSGIRKVIYEPNPDFPTLDNVDIVYLSIELDGERATRAVVAKANRAAGPLVITSYNCRGFLKGGTGDEYPIFPLVAHGFSVMCFEDAPLLEVGERAETSAEYVRIGRGPGLPQLTRTHSALTRAIEMVNEQGLAKTNKIAITGLSAGAALALYDVQHRKYDAAIVSSAISSELFGVLGGAYQQDIYNIWGTDERYFEEIRLDPERTSAPLLINVGDQEFLTSVPTYNDLRDVGHPVEMYVYANEAHVKNQPRHRLAIYNRNIDWLRFWLQGYEDPHSEKEEQYARWRKMRDERCAWDEPEDEKPTYCEYANTVH